MYGCMERVHHMPVSKPFLDSQSKFNGQASFLLELVANNITMKSLDKSYLNILHYTVQDMHLAHTQLVWITC